MDGVAEDDDRDDEDVLTNVGDVDVVLIIVVGGSPPSLMLDAPEAWSLLEWKPGQGMLQSPHHIPCRHASC